MSDGHDPDHEHSPADPAPEPGALTPLVADDEQPPRVWAQGRVMARHPTDGQQHAGTYGTVVVPEDHEVHGTVALVKQVRRDDHRIRNVDGYAISTNALDIMRTLAIERVYIMERDTGDVLEYLYEDFTEWGDLLPESHRDHPEHRQRYVRCSDPLALWPDHADRLIVDSDLAVSRFGEKMSVWKQRDTT
jgi:hypothetical protein